MSIRARKVVSIVLLLVLLVNMWSVSILAGSDAPTQALAFDGTQSGWAQNEVDEAYQYGLTYSQILSHYQNKISREEFCVIVVKLYEKLTHKLADFESNPFKDTTNPEILKAYKLGIVNGTSTTTFSPNNPINRQEICKMIYKTLAVSGVSMEYDASWKFPFSDAASVASWAKSSMLYCYTKNIMKGLSATTIGPLNNTTREQAIILLKRTFVNYTTDPLPQLTTVAAVTASSTTLLIQDKGKAITTIGTASASDSAKLPVSEEKSSAQFSAMVKNNEWIKKYDERINLYGSTTEEKPAILPTASNLQGALLAARTPNEVLGKVGLSPVFRSTMTLNQVTPNQLKPMTINTNVLQPVTKPEPFVALKETPTYVDENQTIFVNTNISSTHWFATSYANTLAVNKVVWQVSTKPFDPYSKSWQFTDGLVGSGELYTGYSFNIDFAPILATIKSKEPANAIAQVQWQLYVRAIPIDKYEKIIGDAGDGLSVLVGMPKVSEQSKTSPIQATAKLYSVDSGLGRFSGEFQDLLAEKPNGVGVTATDKVNSHLFQLVGISGYTKELYVQVSNVPFDNTTSQWPSKNKIIYEKKSALPTKTLAQNGLSASADTEFPNTLTVQFDQFAPKASEMVRGEYVRYYVRGVAIRPSETPGEVIAEYTSTINVDYGFATMTKIYSNDPYTNHYSVGASLPGLKMIHYEPIKFADPECWNHYVVYRAPKAEEITTIYRGANGVYLYPYDTFHKAYYASMGIKSKEDYETKMIPQVLQSGYTLYFPPPKKVDKSWYNEIIDGVTGFFEDVVGIASTITNQVTSAYNNLKSGLVNFVVQLCPIESLKVPFKLALEAAINSGMIACGLPPSLPSFDELLSMNVSYLAKTALTEAGVPQNELTDELVDKVSEEMTKQLSKSNEYADPNPLGASFLKLDPAYGYRPAYVDVEMSNDSKFPSIAGTFDLATTFEMNYYTMDELALTIGTDFQPGTLPAITEYVEYSKHFLHDLNNNTVNYKAGDVAIYNIFDKKIEQKIPKMAPYEKTTVRVYLSGAETCSGQNPNNDSYASLDFYNMYFSNGTSKYTNFTITGNFQSAREYYAKGTLITYPEDDYYYETSLGYTSQRLKENVKTAWTN